MVRSPWQIAHSDGITDQKSPQLTSATKSALGGSGQAVGTALANPYQRGNNRPGLAQALVRVRGRCTSSQAKRAQTELAATMRS